MHAINKRATVCGRLVKVDGIGIKSTRDEHGIWMPSL